MMDKLTLEISADVASALRVPPEDAEKEVRKELALALYARQILPLGKARLLAQLSRRDFEALLLERRIPRSYSEHDLEADISNAREAVDE